MNASKQSTITYHHPVLGRRLRPGRTMPLDAHRECGDGLKFLWLATSDLPGAQNAISNIRILLDEWVVEERRGEVFDESIREMLYFPGMAMKIFVKPDNQFLIEILRDILCILISAYPDSEPLRSLVRQIGDAMESISSWDGNPRKKSRPGPLYLRQLMPQPRA